MSAQRDYIIVDKKVAQNIVHALNHLHYDLIPDDIMNLKFKTRAGNEVSFKMMVDDTKKRIATISSYLSVGLQEQK